MPLRAARARAGRSLRRAWGGGPGARGSECVGWQDDAPAQRPLPRLVQRRDHRPRRAAAVCGRPHDHRGDPAGPDPQTARHAPTRRTRRRRRVAVGGPRAAIADRCPARPLAAWCGVGMLTVSLLRGVHHVCGAWSGVPRLLLQLPPAPRRPRQRPADARAAGRHQERQDAAVGRPVDADHHLHLQPDRVRLLPRDLRPQRRPAVLHPL